MDTVSLTAVVSVVTAVITFLGTRFTAKTASATEQAKTTGEQWYRIVERLQQQVEALTTETAQLRDDVSDTRRKIMIVEDRYNTAIMVIKSMLSHYPELRDKVPLLRQLHLDVYPDGDAPRGE